MKKKPTEFAEKHRDRKTPEFASNELYGNNGVFHFSSPLTVNEKKPRRKRFLACIISDQEGWDHVSIHGIRSKGEYTPTWNEMCYIKDLFFDKDEWVMQYHPEESAYVNVHPHTLHLWRPHNKEIPKPPIIMV